MTASFHSRIALMEAGYAEYFSANNHVKKCLAEGIFWLADSIEEEIRQHDYALQRKAIADLSDIKDIAEQSFKDPKHWVGTQEFAMACARLIMSLPD